jgi:hypothetical protein
LIETYPQTRRTSWQSGTVKTASLFDLATSRATNIMTTSKDIHPIVMKVLDELSERYFIHKRPTV